jgi:uncharacterized membrane protein
MAPTWGGALFRHHLNPEPGFHWRGGEITRLEAFSDAVFAFAVTLLVVSLEVPHTFDELMDVIRGFPAFAICFSMLILVWYNHARFFRRYGMQDPAIQALNGMLLFVVLFYVYPLKFLFTMLVALMTRGATSPHAHPVHDALSQSDVPTLMSIYGLGYAAVFGIFAWMHILAYKRRAQLELNELEVMKTRRSVLDHCAMAGFGILSTALALALPVRLSGLAGWVYMFIGPYHAAAGTILGKKERVLRERLELSETKRTSA